MDDHGTFVDEFWRWFQGSTERLQDAVSQSDYDWLVNNLGAEISKLKPDKPGINWEAHKVTEGEFEFAFSPTVNGNRDLVNTILNAAPQLSDWVFYPCRQSKPYPTWMQIHFPCGNQGHIVVNAENWQFAVQAERGEERVDVLFVSDRPPNFDDVSKRRLCWLLLNNALGEHFVLDHIRHVGLLPADVVPDHVPLAPVTQLVEGFSNLNSVARP